MSARDRLLLVRDVVFLVVAIYAVLVAASLVGPR